MTLIDLIEDTFPLGDENDIRQLTPTQTKLLQDRLVPYVQTAYKDCYIELSQTHSPILVHNSGFVVHSLRKLDTSFSAVNRLLTSNSKAQDILTLINIMLSYAPSMRGSYGCPLNYAIVEKDEITLSALLSIQPNFPDYFKSIALIGEFYADFKRFIYNSTTGFEIRQLDSTVNYQGKLYAKIRGDSYLNITDCTYSVPKDIIEGIQSKKGLLDDVEI